jgi:hypothetical protein
MWLGEKEMLLMGNSYTFSICKVITAFGHIIGRFSHVAYSIDTNVISGHFIHVSQVTCGMDFLYFNV